MNILPKVLAKAFVEDEEDDIVKRTAVPNGGHKQLGKIIEISTADIIPNPNQPRRHFSIDELTSLAKSISQDGIIQPLTVRKIESRFELVSGERRLRAAKMAGLKNVPCILINADEERSAVIALIENIQRADLNFFEEAYGISKLIDTYKLTQEEIAVRLGLAQSTIANKLRILRLTKEEQQIIINNKMSERHARALLKITDEAQRKTVLAKAVENSWNVESTEKYILNMERESIKQDSYKKRAVMLKDIRLFFNTINKAVSVMKMAGVEADTQRINHEDYIEYIIKIPSSDKHKL